jgi:hypothetical protein
MHNNFSLSTAVCKAGFLIGIIMTLHKVNKGQTEYYLQSGCAEVWVCYAKFWRPVTVHPTKGQEGKQYRALECRGEAQMFGREGDPCVVVRMEIVLIAE